MDVLQLVARISLDSSEYERGLSKAKSDAAGMSGAIGGAMSKVGSAIGGAVKLAAAGVTAATGAVTAFTGASVKAGMDFDAAMAQVAATSGKSVSEIQNLRDFALDMGSTTAFSATQAAEALNYMALAGYDADQSMGMLPNVLNLAAAGGMELATASDMVTDAATALGLTLEDGSVDIQRTTQMVDEMAVVSSKTNTSVSQLGSAMLTVGGTAKTLSGGFYTLKDGTQVAYDGTAELSQALGLLADNGIKGSEGGTKLRNMILSLSAPTDKAAAAIKDLGVDVFDAEGNMRSLKDIFGDMAVALDDMTAEQRVNAINTIFNKTDIKAVNALLGTNVERWDEVAMAIDGAEGAAQKMANTQLDNLAGDVTMFKSALEGVQIAISDGVTPKLREFVQLATQGLSDITAAIREGDWEKAFSILGESIGIAITKLTDMLPQMVEFGGRLLSSLADGVFQNIDTIISSAEKIIDTLMTGMLHATEGGSGASEVMQKISDALIRNAAKFMEVGGQILLNIINGLTENLPSLIETAGQIVLALANGIIEQLPELMPKMVEVVMAIVQGIADNADKLIEAAESILTALAEGLINSISILTDKAPEIVQSLVDALSEKFPELEVLFQGLGDAVQAVFDILGKVVDKVGEFIDWFTSGSESAENFKGALEVLGAFLLGYIGTVEAVKLAQMAWQAVTEGVTIAQKLLNLAMEANPIGLIIGLISALVAAIIYLWNNNEDFRNFWIGAWENIKEVFSNVVAAVKEGINNIKEWFGGVKEKVGEVVEGIKEKFDGIIEGAKTWAKDMIDNFVGGITSKIEDVKTAASNIAGAIRSFLHFSKPDEGPLADFDTYGPDMMELLAQGVENSVGTMAERIKFALETVKQVFIDFIDEVVTMFNGDEGLITSINTLFEEWGFTFINETLPALFRQILDLITLNMSEESEIFTVIRTFFEQINLLIDEFVSLETENGLLFKLTTLFTALFEMLDEKLLGEEGVYGKLKIFFEQLQADIDEFFEQLTTKITEALDGVYTAISEWTETLSTLIAEWFTAVQTSIDDFFTKLTEDVETNLDAMRTTIEQWFDDVNTVITTKLEDWNKSITEFMDNMKKTLDDWFKAEEEYIRKWFDTINDFLKKWFDDVKSALQSFLDDTVSKINSFFSTLNSTVTTQLNSIVSTVKAKLNEIGSFISSWISSQLSALNQFISSVQSTITNALTTWNSQIQTWFTTLGSWLRTTFSTWDSELRTWLDSLKSFIDDWFDKMKQFLRDDWFKDLEEFLHTWFEDMMEFLKDEWFEDLRSFLEDEWFEDLNTFLTDWFDNLNEYLTEWFDNLRSYLDGWFENTINGIREMMKEAKKVVKNACEKIADAINEVVDAAYGWGSELGANFAEGIRSQVGAVAAAAAELAAAAAGAIHFSTPDYGPLKEEDKWGGELVDNFINSMMSRAGALRKATENVFDLKEAMLSSGEDVGSGFIDGLVDGIKEGSNFLKDAVSDLDGVMTANVFADQPGMGRGYTQIINNYSPEALDASEIARQTRNATQSMVLALRSA